MMATYGILGQTEEDAIHKTRLLAVEEKPFRRIARRLLQPASPLTTPPALPPSPPHSPSDTSPPVSKSRPASLEVESFRTDILLDFSAYNSFLCRSQFLLHSNTSERARYDAERERILSTAEAVRASTLALRHELERVQEMLERRKKWDVLAEKITSNRMLKPRDDQWVSIERLESEIRELEGEKEGLGRDWLARKEGFETVVAEETRLGKIISGEVASEEEDGVDEAEAEGGHEDDGPEAGTLAMGSAIGTPRTIGGAETPLHEVEGLHGGIRPPLSNRPSTHLSPAVGSPKSGGVEEKDVLMAVEAEQGEVGEGIAEEREEGEEDEDEGVVYEADGDQMDVS